MSVSQSVLMSTADFLSDWRNGLIIQVVTSGSFHYGRSVRNAVDRNVGYIIVYAPIAAVSAVPVVFTS